MKSIAKAHAARMTSLSLVLLMLAVTLLSVVIPLTQIVVNPHPVQTSWSTITPFYSTQTWTVPANVTSVQVLVVGGGGGGGGASVAYYAGGGGGGGGINYNSSYAISTATIDIVVGGGGSAGSSSNNSYCGGNGSPSSFGNPTTGYVNATGGGGGGRGTDPTGGPTRNGQNGACGGGGGVSTSGAGGGGTGSQGKNGASAYKDGTAGDNAAGGGGGNATQPSDATSQHGGPGGTGGNYSSVALFDITYGENGFFSGGGGGGCYQTGGAKGTGGGGAGASSSGSMNGKNGNSATDYTGGGGGGGGGGWGVTNVKGGQGGSGVVLVKYTLCTLTTATGGGGSVTTPGSGSYTETQYSLTAITATPDSCHTFSSWTVTAGSGTLTDSSSASTTINMTDNCTVQANFAYKTYTLTYINGSHGSISGILTQIVNCGASGSAVTAVPDACYHFTTWSDTGTSTNPRTDTGVVASVTATANFAINTYTLTYINGSHGSISGILTQTVNCGADGSAVTAVPDACYHFTTWSDTGTSTNPRTDTGVVASVTATANFAINTYTLNVNASPSAGGSASGGGSGINCGTNATVVATTNSGYAFINWTQTAGLASNITIWNPNSATTNITVNGTANVTANYNTAPTITSITLQQSDKSNATSSMSPQTAYNVKIVAGDADTINDINQIDIWIFYEADSNHNGIPSGSWDCDQEAIYRWAKSGSTWSMQNSSAVTTWGITTASCDTPSPMTATSGTWNLYFTVGKLAVKADGSSTAWDIKVLVTDSVSQTASNTTYNKSMGSYTSLSLSSSTIDFGSMNLGSTTAIQAPSFHYITLQAITNSAFSLGGKSSSPWTSGGNSVTLDISGTPTTAGSFALNYDDAGNGDGHPSTPQPVTTSTATITGHNADARTSTAAGASEATNSTNMYMDCKLYSSGIPYGTYSGTITFTITNN